jgi:hypothetical protein
MKKSVGYFLNHGNLAFGLENNQVSDRAINIDPNQKLIAKPLNKTNCPNAPPDKSTNQAPNKKLIKPQTIVFK